MSRVPDARKLEANRTAASEANNEVALYAGEFAQHFMAGSFSSMMYVERSSEVAEPGLFDLSTEPARLESRRMSARHWLQFDFALLNDELLARRYVRELEYEFVLVLDISRSLTEGWFEAVDEGAEQWKKHTCYRLKYLAYALLNSALREGFACRVVFLDQGQSHVRTAREDESFPFAVIELMDELIAERPKPPEELEQIWMWDSVLRELAQSSDQMLVAVISDFLDPVQGQGIDEPAMLAALSRLRYTKRLMVLQVNNERDVQDAHPVTHSLRAFNYEESGDKRGRGEKWVIEARGRLCDWLGRLDVLIERQGEYPGRLEARLTAERVPYQKFWRTNDVQDINARLESLAYGVLQV